MMNDKNKLLLMVVLAIGIVLILWSLSCKKKEGYVSGQLGSQCSSLRAPVNYFSDYSMSPTWRNDPYSKFKPLENAPVDFYPNLRKLEDPDRLYDDINPNYENERKNLSVALSETTPDYHNMMMAVRSGDLNAYRALRPLDVPIY